MLTLALVVLLAAPAEDPQVRAGVSAYDELRYRDAIVLLERALANVTLTRDDQIAALGALARAHAVLFHEGDAQAAFAHVLELEPTYLVSYEEPPAITQAFQAARTKFEATHPQAMQRVMPPPARPVWPWIAGGAVVAAGTVVAIIVLSHHSTPHPSNVNDVWRVP